MDLGGTYRGCATPPSLHDLQLSDITSILLKFVYFTCQLCYPLVITPLLGKFLDPPLKEMCLHHVFKMMSQSVLIIYNVTTIYSQLIPSTFTLSDPNLGGGFYFYYSLLSNDVTNEVFQDLLQPNFPAERASVRINSNLEVLTAFFAQHAGLEVNFE